VTANGRLDRWLAALLSTPGLTAVSEVSDARRVHIEDALAAADLLERGPVVDVGSGGGSPGLPLAAVRPELEFHLLEASGKKCAFLRDVAREFPNVAVVCARAEDHARGPGRDAYGTALARALAAPPVALEWCLPLVQVGGRFVLYAGEAEDARAAAAAVKLGARLADIVPVPASERRRLLLFEKIEPTPPGFPRRTGIARKRPLA
jgi:16S rRNA (guanine527-N7)-methyltransferase